MGLLKNKEMRNVRLLITVLLVTFVFSESGAQETVQQDMKYRRSSIYSILVSHSEQAKMRLLFSFDEANGTRGVTQGESSTGTELEYGVTKITAVLDYGDGSPRVIVKELTLQEGEGQGKTKIATTEAFAVTAGTGVKLYAFVNPTGLNITQKTDLDQLAVGDHSKFTGATLAYIDNDVAKDGAFLMSGETTMTRLKLKRKPIPLQSKLAA